MPRWWLLAALWLLQAAVVYTLGAWIFESQTGVDGPGGNLVGVAPDFTDWVRTVTDLSFAAPNVLALAALTAAQALLVWNIRMPGITGERGHGVRTSLAIAGGAIAVLTIASGFMIHGFLDAYELGISIDTDLLFFIPAGPWIALGIVLLPTWYIAARLLFAFVKPGPRESVLAKVSQRLFAGTIIELALLIPLDVMVRRKTNCYCYTGAYWGLTLCGFVGLFALGPAVFIPLLAKRRKPWYDNHCGVCGYDLSGTPDAPRCPECGTGWRPAPKSPQSTPRDNPAQSSR